MLKSVVIQNYALLENISLTFEEGLNVISGETGSGKSILVQAISGLLGVSADKDAIRPGKDVAVIEGVFTAINSSALLKKFSSMDLDYKLDESLVLRREILSSGRSRYLINSQAVKKKDFVDCGWILLDVNSQHDHQMLLDKKCHLVLLDRALSIEQQTKKIAENYARLKQLSEKIETLTIKNTEQQKRKQLYEFQMAEIDQAKIYSGEKNELIDESKRLRNADELQNLLQESCGLLQYQDISLSYLSGKIVNNMQKTVQRDPSLESLLDQAESISVLIEGLSDEVRTTLENTNWSTDRLNDISARLHFIQELEGKYRNDIDGIIEYRRDIERRLAEYDSITEQINMLKNQWKKEIQTYRQLDKKLTEVRQKGSKHLSQSICSILKSVGMDEAQFDVSFIPTTSDWDEDSYNIPSEFTLHGTDRIEFVLSANPGMSLLPLRKVASGGELSRIMLALKQHFITEDCEAVIFDEVDAGIGGNTAASVARQIKKLSKNKQILCVTHLSQIAMQADRHIRVQKDITNNSTSISVDILNQEEKITELARMLAGKEDDIQVRKLAQSMLDDIQE